MTGAKSIMVVYAPWDKCVPQIHISKNLIIPKCKKKQLADAIANQLINNQIVPSGSPPQTNQLAAATNSSTSSGVITPPTPPPIPMIPSPQNDDVPSADKKICQICKITFKSEADKARRFLVDWIRCSKKNPCCNYWGHASCHNLFFANSDALKRFSKSGHFYCKKHMPTRPT